MPSNENTFTFDTSPFMQGINKIANGMGALTKGASNMAKNVSKGIMNATAKLGLLAGAFRLVKGAIGEMEEIGKTFGMVKGIITKNLLFPLRKAIFPLLQKFLNWTRDNRAMFVKWGQTLANVFESIVSAVESVMRIGDKMFRLFLGFINKVFGTNIKTLNELFNVLSFKFAVVLELIKALLDPVFSILKRVANLFAGAIRKGLEAVQNFIIGFVEGLGDIDSFVSDILTMLEDIVNELSSVTEEGNSIETIFRTIGGIFGSIVKWVKEMVKSFVEGFKPHIQPILDGVQGVADAAKSLFDSLFGSNESIKGWKGIFKTIGDIVGGTLVAGLKLLENAIKGITSFIENLQKAIDGVLEGLGIIESKRPTYEQHQEIKKENEALMQKKEQDKIFGDKPPPQTSLADAFSFGPPVNDAIVQSNGNVIPVNSMDDIMAFKPGGPIEKSFSGQTVVNIDFQGMQVIVKDTSPEEASRFSESLVDSFRRTLSRELEQGGTF